jgi:DNA-binding MarR family transcriptional regulator
MTAASNTAEAHGHGPGAFILALLFQVARALRTDLEREVAQSGITSQQAGLLLNAWRHRGISPGQLAAPLGTDTAGMTRLLDRLEAKGLVFRRSGASDRRLVAIELTEAGSALVPQLTPVFHQVNARLLAGLTDEEVRRLEQLLRRLRDNLLSAEEVAAQGPMPEQPAEAAERSC